MPCSRGRQTRRASHGADDLDHRRASDVSRRRYNYSAHRSRTPRRIGLASRRSRSPLSTEQLSYRSNSSTRNSNYRNHWHTPKAGMAFAPRNNVNCDNRAHPSRSTNNWRFETRAEAPASLPARQNPSTSPPKIKTELSTNSPSSESIIQTHNHDHRERKIMPKDFLQPMTCFYWATQGRCTKTADECFYAHWDTGVIASAPVSMARDGQSVTVAGRHADAQIADFIARENSLKTRELALNSRQMLLNQHEAALNARCANMKTAMQEVYDTIETFDHESAEALRALHRRKKQIEEFNVATATEGQPSEYGALLLFAVNGSIGAVTKMALRVDEVGNYMKEHIGINAVHEASVAAFVQANSHV